MSPSAKLIEFRQAAPQTRTLPELNAWFKACARAFGFTAYAVGMVPGQRGSADPFLLLDWPRAWLELYAREGFAGDDAVIAAALTAHEPFTWTELRAQQPDASARIFAAASRFGWNDGLLVPVRPYGGSGTALAGVVSLAAPTLDGLSPSKREEIVEASTIVFRRALELADTPQSAGLSGRERQVIAYVADGRSDREIAAALQISVSTAHFHVEQAKRKLGAATRAQAVASAAALGLLPIG